MPRPAACVALLVVTVTAGVTAQQQAPDAWASFRGPHGSGVAASATPPLTWNVTTSANVAWRTPIPGLGHSNPIVWGDWIFLTTAISGDASSQTLALGESGGIDPVSDQAPHEWRLLALDRDSGKIVWTRTVHEGRPRVKRHPKASSCVSDAGD